MANLTRRAAIASAVASAAAPAAFAQPANEGRIAVPGGQVWWKRVGAGAKTPLLVLHGGPGAGHDYLTPLAALADERPVIFYDQLGCGRSDSPPDETLYTFHRSIVELEAIREALKLDRVILYGHSWGSMLAIEYLCQERGTGVDKLVLAGALASVPQCVAGMQRLIADMPDGAGARLHALEAAHQESSPEYQALVERFYRLHVCRLATWPPEVTATVNNLSASIAYRVMNGPNEFTITGVIRDWDRRRDLKRIAVPTLITTGEFDEVSLDCHQTIRDGVPGSRLEVLPGCSHLTMNEKPADYAALVRHFIA